MGHVSLVLSSKNAQFFDIEKALLLLNKTAWFSEGST
jgi:hypothetical protein